MEPMLVLLLTIVGVLLLAWGFRGIRLYRSYKGDIYAALYGGFLPYFYRYVIIRDCSVSSYLRGRIGFHRLVFSVVTGDDQSRTRFCIIFYNKGIMVLCYEKAPGEYRGNSSAKSWNVIRTGGDGKQHIFRRSNPSKDVKAYLSRITAVFPGVHVEARLAFCDDADISQLRSDIKAIHFSEMETELKNVQAEFLTDEEITAMYQKLIQK